MDTPETITYKPQNIEQIDIKTQSDITIDVVKRVDQFTDLQEDWEKLFDQTDAHIFQSFDWIYTWWKYFGPPNDLHLVTFRIKNELIGIAPFFIETYALGGISYYKKMRFIGDAIPHQNARGSFAIYSPSDYLDIFTLPDYEEIVAQKLVDYLHDGNEIFDEIELNDVPGNGIVANFLIPALNEDHWQCLSDKTEVCPRLPAPDDMDTFMNDLKRKVRYEFRYSKRAFTEKDLLNLQNVRTNEDFKKIYPHFIQLHQDRWNSQGNLGAFVDQRFRDFFEEVSLAFLDKEWLWLKSAFDNENNCIAVQYSVVHNQHVYDYQKAFDATSSLAKYSPGKGLQFFLIREASEQQMDVIDYLRGDEKYKFNTATETIQNWTYNILGKKSATSLKSKLFQLHLYLFKLKQYMYIRKKMFSIENKRDGMKYAIRSFFSKIWSDLGLTT